jgi:predicted dienelactone hydrolase
MTRMRDRQALIGTLTAAAAFALIFSCRPFARGAPAPAPDLSAPGPLAAETIDFPDLKDAARDGRPLPVKVHVPEAGGPCPVVVLSHGGGGHRDANFAQAHHLATHGFVVLCTEHPGSNTEVLKRGFRITENLKSMTRDASEVLGRPKDVRFALDRAAEWNRDHERLRSRMDLARVGMMGHSFGAYTTLVVCGARPALDWLAPPVPPGKGLAPDLSDPRVSCGVALSPQGPGEPFFSEAGFATIRTPLLGITGSRDMQQGLDPENRRRGFALWPEGNKILLWLANADHTAFSDSTGAPGRRAMLPSAARDDAQPVARAATLLFFRAHLRKEEPAMKLLTAEALRPYCRGKVDSLEVLEK